MLLVVECVLFCAKPIYCCREQAEACNTEFFYLANVKYFTIFFILNTEVTENQHYFTNGITYL